MGTDDPLVAISDLRAGYGGLDVVDGLSLIVRRGEIAGLLGRNGAGKSTTLRAIAGLVPRSSGEIHIGGRLLAGPAHRRTRSLVGLVLEGRSVFANLAVKDNLEISQIRAEDACALFPELTSRLQVRAGLLSGGEQQMLALARAILRRPQFLLIDELSFGLSPAACKRLFEALKTAVAASGMAVLLVEQHVPSAVAVADRVYIMQDGRIALQLGASELERRADEIASLYLGSR
jgi:branched-chain amino acid transport system ATP-binding protein